MTTGAIIAIVVVVALVLIALAVLMPRNRVRRQERELNTRRERVAGEHRAAADVREREADEAERRARLAAKEADAQRAQAELHQERAGLTEQGMADHELIDADERDRFAGTSADRNGALSGDGDMADDSRDYQRGRADEAQVENDADRPARFRREDETVEERDRPARF